MELIDKEKVVAEIEWRIILLENNSDGIISMLASEILANEYKDLLSFLNTLEVKEVDFNTELSKFIDTFYKNTKVGHRLMIRRTAKYFFELGLKAKKGE